MAMASKKGTRSAKRGANILRHKVFVSYHDCDADRPYKDRFIELLQGSIIDKSVHDDDIDDDPLKTETVRQKIRDEFIADASVTVVLVGTRTWQRKHVDWEIGSSLRKTKRNSRCGLLGILLPCHPNHRSRSIKSNLLPPKLADNMQGNGPYAKLYKWPTGPSSKKFRRWIHEAFLRREGNPPNNGRRQFGNNRSGNWATGWPTARGYPERFPLN